MKHTHLNLWLPCILFYGFLSSLSFLTGQQVEGFYLFPHIDKLTHLFLFLGFGLILSRAFRWENKKKFIGTFWWALLIVSGLILAYANESLQLWQKNREISHYDVLFNVLGVVLGAGVYLFWVQTLSLSLRQSLFYLGLPLIFLCVHLAFVLHGLFVWSYVFVFCAGALLARWTLLQSLPLKNLFRKFLVYLSAGLVFLIWMIFENFISSLKHTGLSILIIISAGALGFVGYLVLFGILKRQAAQPKSCEFEV